LTIAAGQDKKGISFFIYEAGGVSAPFQLPEISPEGSPRACQKGHNLASDGLCRSRKRTVTESSVSYPESGIDGRTVFLTVGYGGTSLSFPPRSRGDGALAATHQTDIQG
jgi:hypothetical protein